MILSLVNIIYYRTFEICVDEKPFGTLVVLDHGVKLCNAFVPYESLISVGYQDDTMFVNFFLHETDVPKKHHVKFQVNNPSHVMKNIKDNMYYHLKYNKPDKELIEDWNKKID